MPITYTLPADLYGATLYELPLTWHLDVRCAACERGGGWSLWWLAEHHRGSTKVGTILRRARCRCRARIVSAQLRETPPRGQGGNGWQARTVDIIIPPPTPPPPVLELREEDHVDF